MWGTNVSWPAKFGAGVGGQGEVEGRCGGQQDVIQECEGFSWNWHKNVSCSA